MNKAEMVRDIEALCRQHNITLVYRKTQGGRACKRHRWIKIGPIKSDVGYFIALHEIGHVVQPGAASGKNIRLIEEALAWKWALDNAAVEPSRRVKGKLFSALRSYLRRARRRRGMKLPPPEHLFWRYLREFGPVGYEP